METMNPITVWLWNNPWITWLVMAFYCGVIIGWAVYDYPFEDDEDE